MDSMQIHISGTSKLKILDDISSEQMLTASLTVKILNQTQTASFENEEPTLDYEIKAKPSEFGGHVVTFTAALEDVKFTASSSFSFPLFGQSRTRRRIEARSESGEKLCFIWSFEVTSIEIQNLLEVCIPAEIMIEHILDLSDEWRADSILQCNFFEDEIEVRVEDLPYQHLAFISLDKKETLQAWVAKGDLEICLRSKDGGEVIGKANVSIGDVFDTQNCFLHYDSFFCPQWAGKAEFGRTNPFLTADGLKSSVELKIRSACKLSHEPPQPFSRAVFMFPRDDGETLKTVVNHIFESNLIAMDVKGPLKQCFAIQLTDEQKQSQTLDILTGFHVISKWRIFVVEGLLHGESMKSLTEKLPKVFNQSKRFFLNPEVTFKNRIYSEFDLAPKTIRLTQELDTISKLKDVYLTFDPELHESIMNLVELRHSVAELRKAKFPTARGLNLLEEKFGGFVSEPDLGFEEREIVSSRSHTTVKERISASEILQSTKKPDLSEAEQLRQAFEELTKKEEVIEEPSTPPRDFVQEHIDQYTTSQEEVQARKLRTRIQTDEAIFPYSSQRLNYREHQKKKVIQKEEKSGKIRCYSNDFQSTHLVENFAETTDKFKTLEASRKKFTDPKGFSLHTLSHSLPENQKLYLENEFVHPENSYATRRELPFNDHTYQKPERREVFSWNPNPRPNQPFEYPGNDDWGKPLFRGDDGETQSAEAKRKMREEFAEKMIVDTLNMKTHLAADMRKISSSA